MKYLIVALCVGTALARPDGAGHGGHHDHGHAAPAAAPSSGYQEPSAGYQEPAYQEPAYAAAPSGYEQPAYESGYGAPTGGYSSYDAVQEPSNGLNLNLIIIPILIIAGLALLFPSVTTVAVKRKRSAEEEVSGNSLVDRVQDIFMSVVESEECMERIACEMGGIVADAGLSKNIFTMAEAVTPVKYTKMMKKFSSGKDCHKIKCGGF